MRKLRAKLGLVGGDIKPFMLEKLVNLNVSVDDLLRENKICRETVDISGAGLVSVFTVPAGKRWYVSMLEKPLTTAATYVQVITPTSTGYLSIIPSGTALVLKEFQFPLVLESEWRVRANGTGNGADNARTFTMMYTEEELGSITQ